MEHTIKSINDIIEKLPPEKQNEVFSFAKRLLQKQKRSSTNRIDISWAGALKEFRDKYTSLDLQRKAMEWWGD